ncbi:ubiquinol-cytochrome-c reductase cytochrome c1 [Fusarium austroafricanum]|uniref:Ubiquinol-cytochrome-c reductase cytochrome c1 n=1 Tax=Fusarium austroafricanum TaxID=2364996 RepID=A0A8H4KDI7_9HYPO|nr:ubiquinol-cytochrome-c reductase cytochrome c1 [Fusarium austroafricanum]
MFNMVSTQTYVRDNDKRNPGFSKKRKSTPKMDWPEFLAMFERIIKRSATRDLISSATKRSQDAHSDSTSSYWSTFPKLPPKSCPKPFRPRFSPPSPSSSSSDWRRSSGKTGLELEGSAADNKSISFHSRQDDYCNMERYRKQAFEELLKGGLECFKKPTHGDEIPWQQFLTKYDGVGARFGPQTPSSTPSESGQDTTSLSKIMGNTCISTPPFSSAPPVSISTSPLQVHHPLRTQCLILTRIQNILEHACFHFAKNYMSDILWETGWTCPEAGELNIWTYHFKCRLNLLNHFGRARVDDLNLPALLYHVRRIRNIGIHRERIPTDYLSLLMDQAIILCNVLRVPKAMDKIQKIRESSEAQIQELSVCKEKLEQELSLMTYDSDMPQTEIWVLKYNHWRGVCERFEKQRVAVFKKVENLLQASDIEFFNTEEDEVEEEMEAGEAEKATSALPPSTSISSTLAQLPEANHGSLPVIEVAVTSPPMPNTCGSRTSPLILSIANTLTSWDKTPVGNLESEILSAAKHVTRLTGAAFLFYLIVMLIGNLAEEFLAYWAENWHQWLILTFCAWAIGRWRSLLGEGEPSRED